jgi:hypothetical protein
MPSWSPKRSLRHLHRLGVAALIAAAATLGGSAVGSPAIACAEPNSGEWDIEQYDKCIHDYLGDPLKDTQAWFDHVKLCCWLSGGKWDGANCMAPPAGAQSGPQANLPPGGLPTLQPLAPPTGAATPTQAPIG